MKFIAAYLLAQLGSASATASPPGKADVWRILGSVGVEVEEGRMDMLFAELEGKDFAELIAAGRERLACAGAGMAGVAAGVGAGEAKEEEKEKEEEKVVVVEEEGEEEEDDDLVFSLFDDE